MKYRKKPAVIDAWQIPDEPEAAEELLVEIVHPPEVYVCLSDPEDDFSYGGIEIQTLEGTMRGVPGDWLIRGVQGEYYPVKPDIFEATYEPVEEGADA